MRAKIAVAFFLAALTTLLHAQSQVPPDAAPPRVTSFDELRAKTGEERVRATYFDRFSIFGTKIPERLPQGGVWGRSGGRAHSLDLNTVLRQWVCTTDIVFTSPVPISQPGACREETDPEMQQRVDAYLRAVHIETTRRFACERAAIFIGRALSRRVLMNTREEWLFTDFTVIPDRWIISRASASLRPTGAATSIVYSAEDGEVILNGQRLATASGGSEWLRVGQRSLFLVDPLEGGGTHIGLALEIREDGTLTVPELASSHSTVRPAEEFIADLLREAKSCGK